MINTPPSSYIKAYNNKDAALTEIMREQADNDDKRFLKGDFPFQRARDLYSKLIQEMNKPYTLPLESVEILKHEVSVGLSKVSLSKNERQVSVEMFVDLERQLSQGEKPSSDMLTTLSSFPQGDVLRELSQGNLELPCAILYLLNYYKLLDSTDDASIIFMIETAFLTFKEKFLAMPWLKDHQDREELIKEVWKSLTSNESPSFDLEGQEAVKPGALRNIRSSIFILMIKNLLENDIETLKSIFLLSAKDSYIISIHLDEVIMYWDDNNSEPLPSVLPWPVTPALECCEDNNWDLLKNYFIDSVREEIRNYAESEPWKDIPFKLKRNIFSYIIKIPPLTDAQREYIEGAFPQLNPKRLLKH